MATDTSVSNDEAQRRALHDPRRSIRYKLTLELRRLERNGYGNSMYADAICRALDALPTIQSEAVLKLLDRELEKANQADQERPYAGVLSSIFSRVDDHEPSCSKLFEYYLERLEREGRGDEPFANALRRALRSRGSSVSTPFLYTLESDDLDDPGHA